jgi:hypothetical protein
MLVESQRLHLDHVVAVSQGGKDGPKRIVHAAQRGVWAHTFGGSA